VYTAIFTQTDCNMSKPKHHFSNRDEVEQWIEGCIANGMSTQLIYALVQKKTEELSSRRDYFLVKRRQALVGGNTNLATELHNLMKSCESQLQWFGELTGSFHMQPLPAEERILDPETKVELLYRMTQSLN
jgi:hypothetical protein